ncbi:MAG: hypothetical protein EBU33_02160 [Sphingobacteriia bacterium]|nr:hypothetical protein [Sphingobacteriia bacterium]
MATATTKMRLAQRDVPAYQVSWETDLENGTTAVWKKYKVMDTERIELADMQAPNPGFPCGLTSVQVACNDGIAEITWTFRAEFTDDSRSVYELQGSTSQTPITSHPKYQMLHDKYARGERDGEPVWVENDPDGNSGLTGLSSAGAVVSNMSPLYGVTEYLAASSVYNYTKFYTSRSSIPQDLVSRVGKIDAAPTGLGSPGPAGRWLRSGATVRQMGDAFQVTISWMSSQSSAPNGLWKTELYGE